MESHKQIEDEVAERLARRDSGQWTEDDETRLHEWLAVSTARRIAYLRLKSTWDMAGRLRALRSGMSSTTSAGGVPAPGEWRRSPFFEQSTTHALGALQGRRTPVITPEPETLPSDTSSTANPASSSVTSPPIPSLGRPYQVTQRRRRNLVAGIAAAVVLAVTLGLGAYQLWSRGGDRYATVVGGFASVPMIDGSKITLNTDSAIRVALTENERRVQLEQGEAFFEVAKDPRRPFVVHAGDKLITAVGTKFSVRHLGEQVRVLVTEGKVRVEDSNNRGSANSLHTGTVFLTPGEIARAEGSAIVVREAQPAQVDEFLSWREGYLRFHETALADAVAEMNRYNTRKIFIEDQKLAAIRISGTFRPTQYEAFVRVLQDGFSIQARNEGERITLYEGPQP